MVVRPLKRRPDVLSHRMEHVQVGLEEVEGIDAVSMQDSAALRCRTGFSPVSSYLDGS